MKSVYSGVWTGSLKQSGLRFVFKGLKQEFNPKNSATSCNISVALPPPPPPNNRSQCKQNTVFSSSTNKEAASVQPPNCCLSPSPLSPSHYSAVNRASTATECIFHVCFGSHNAEILHTRMQYQLMTPATWTQHLWCVALSLL